jgi:ankyrin repeat protein
MRLFKYSSKSYTNDDDGTTPLHYACLKGHTDIVDLLTSGQWCIAVTAFYVSICANVEELFNNIRIAVLTCDMQWCVTTFVLYVNICANVVLYVNKRANVEECFNNIRTTI